MALRTKTLLILAATMAGLLIAAFAITRAVVLGSYSRLAEQTSDRSVKQAQAAVTADLRELGATADEWAASDEAAAYVEGDNPIYRSQKLTPDVFKGLRVSFMVFLDASGKVVRAQTFDPATGKGVPPPAGLVEQLTPDGQLMQPSGGAHSVMGVVLLPAGPTLVTSHPILGTGHERPARGTLVVGRFLDAGEIAYVSKLANQTVHVERTGFTAASNGAELLRDLTGRPVAALRVGDAGAISEQAGRAVWVLALAFVACGVVFSSVAGTVIERQVLAPVSRLGEGVSAVAASGDTAARVDVEGADELARLGTAINTMLAAVQGSDAALKRARDDLECRVKERTTLLSRANEALTTEVYERKRTEAALRESEERHRALVENMAEAVLVMRMDGTFAFASPRAGALTGHTPECLCEMSYRQVLAPDSLEFVERQLDQRSDEELHRSADVTLLHASGRMVPVEISTTPMTASNGETTEVLWIVRDVTERKRFESQLSHIASHDYLTGLFNRRRFEEELTRRLAEARRHKTEGALLWLDLDRFKEINDSLGHRSGDEILVRLANTLQERCRAENVLARMGGDEFAVLMPHANEAEAQDAAARMLADIRNRTLATDGHQIRVSASVGIVLYPWHGTTVEELLARADLAMYHAKDEGRDRLYLYRPDEEWQSELKSRRVWAQRIEEALVKNQFKVYAQPILDPESNEVSRYELLVRMKGEGDAIIEPAEFLGTAEDLGLIHQIDRWMIRQAVELIAAHRAEGREIHLDVNLSAKAFADEGLLSFIESELRSAGVEPGMLGLEITETAAVDDMGKALEFIRTLKEMGCRFALDDFGSGFSSFYYLKHLPVDVLKIDGSLVRDLPRSPQDQHLVKAIVELARGLGVKATAEYVEEQETLDLLREYGVDYAQGFHIGRPHPASEIGQEPQAIIAPDAV